MSGSGKTLARTSTEEYVHLLETLCARAFNDNFGAPTREKCMVERPRTNTPLQALVTLNDPQFTEAARNLAQRMIKKAAKPRRTALLTATGSGRPQTEAHRGQHTGSCL